MVLVAGATGLVGLLRKGEKVRALVRETSSKDVRHPRAERAVVEFGGPEALSPLSVVRRFEARYGDAMEMAGVAHRFGLTLTSVDAYVRGVLGRQS